MATALHHPLPAADAVTSDSGNKLAATLEGRWEGNIGKGMFVLELRSDGTAAINLRRRVRSVYHPCTWSATGEIIKIRCSHNQSLTLPILSRSEDSMILRMGVDSPDVCLLHRTPFPQKPLHV